MCWLLIPPGASLVTHAARLTRASLPLLHLPDPLLLCPSSESILASGPRYPYQRLGFPFPLSLPLFLFHSSRFLHLAMLHRHASGDTRGPTQVMHGPPYIFDPLFGFFFPTGSNAYDASPAFPRRRSYLSYRPPRPHSFSSRCRALETSRYCPRLSFARALAFSSFLSPLFSSRSCATRRGFERTSSMHIGNACYCPPSYRYVCERHAGGFAA